MRKSRIKVVIPIAMYFSIGIAKGVGGFFSTTWSEISAVGSFNSVVSNSSIADVGQHERGCNIQNGPFHHREFN
jgi:hypothetical protein